MADDVELLAYINERGELVDPMAHAVATAVEQHNCRQQLLTLHRERVGHFMRRISELGRSPADVVIVVLNVDDVHGGPLAAVLMPGFDWAPIRARGEVPFARGLAGREGIQELVDTLDPTQGEKLGAITGMAVVMMDLGVVICEAVPFKED